MIDQTIEEELRDDFEMNFEYIRLEGGVPFTPEIKEQAWLQVLYYYRKLNHIAEKVTDTEVKLTLPNLTSPGKRRYSIEGVVDIVREDDEVWMYDIKTHEGSFISANKEYYSQQLNIYSYIWEKIRQNQLDHTAIISTVLPEELKEAINTGDSTREKLEMGKWEPVIALERNKKKVEEIINDFGCVVDKIESKKFAPPPVEVLEEKIKGTNRKFATQICINCDARFSCSSFREYAAKQQLRGKFDFRKYMDELAEPMEQEEWVNANMNLIAINETINLAE